MGSIQNKITISTMDFSEGTTFTIFLKGLKSPALNSPEHGIECPVQVISFKVHLPKNITKPLSLNLFQR